MLIRSILTVAVLSSLVFGAAANATERFTATDDITRITSGFTATDDLARIRAGVRR